MAYHVYASKSVVHTHKHTQKPLGVFSFCFRVNVAQQVSGELWRQTTDDDNSPPALPLQRAILVNSQGEPVWFEACLCLPAISFRLISGRQMAIDSSPAKATPSPSRAMRVSQSEPRLDCVLIALQAANWIFIIICFSIFAFYFFAHAVNLESA